VVVLTLRGVTLDTSADNPAPLRVVSAAIGQWVGRLGAVWVEAQVAELTLRQERAYLTLRDPLADMSVQASCSRRVLDAMPVPVTEGARVVVHARPSYYDRRGSLSLYVDVVRPVGLGELLARIEQRRRLLAAEGLFGPERKLRLPFLPGCVGLVTGKDSAAERDVLEVARRRWPGVRFRVEHALVQGRDAALQVIEAVRRLDADTEVDVIVVARGGGSMEDLLPFSDEGLVRVVSALRTPLVSAIGHEPDNPILDLVADVRAATPTDAAHRVVPEIGEQRRLVDGLRARARHLLTVRIEQSERWLEGVRSRPVLADPDRLLHGRAEDVVALRDRARRTLTHRVETAERDLDHARARVTALSPQATLQRGYALVQRADGALVRDPGEVADDERLSVRVAGGRLPVRVDRQDGTP
jgi:exodeoxyribonuclease VII large subunit